MNSKKQYGILNPKKIDYLLAGIVAVFAVSALWIGIWVAATGTYGDARQVYENILNAFAFNLAVKDYLVVGLQSVILYSGLLIFLASLLWAIIKKRYWLIQGAIAILIATIALTINVGFVGAYANSAEVGVHGVFAILLAIFTLVILYLSHRTAKKVLRLLMKEREYWAYVDDDQFQYQNQREEVKEEEEPVQEDDDDDYLVVNIADQMDDYWGNSNEYKEKPAPEPEKVEPEKEEVAEEQRAQEDAKEQEVQQDAFGIKSNNYTFEQKLKMAKPKTREYFKELKKYFEEIGFKSQLTKSAQTFVYKNTKYAMITTAGQNGLKIYYKLNPEYYEDSTIPVKDVGEKRKYEKTPLLFVVKSDLAVRRAKSLMDDIKDYLENE